MKMEKKNFYNLRARNLDFEAEIPKKISSKILNFSDLFSNYLKIKKKNCE